jgi:hypothetical protein
MYKRRKSDKEEKVDLDNYNEKDQHFLKKRLDYEKFLESKKILNNRIISLEDIIQCDITSEKRANLIERYEILQQLLPYTSEFIECRNQLRNLFQKYTNQRPISEDPDIDEFEKRLSDMVLSTDNLFLIKEKIDEYQEINREEKYKLKRWLLFTTSLPFDRIVSINYDISQKLKETKLYLDKSLYGMKNVKERLLLFLHKKLRNQTRGCNLALLGKPGVGKCLHPNTPVRMYNLSIKLARDVIVGDRLMGDDSTPRHVTSITNGTEEMYEIFQQYGQTYRVNQSHILTLYRKCDNKIVDVSILKVIGNEHFYNPISGYYFGHINLSFNEIMNYVINPNLLKPICLDWNRTTKELFYSILTNNFQQYQFNLSYPCNQLVELIQSMGNRCKVENNILYCLPVDSVEVFRIHSIGHGFYNGFTITNNERFLLGDWTVTHNTAIAKALSKCLDLPFAQINFGGITTSEFLLGHDYTYIGSRPGEISRCLSHMKTKNGILFFDEFDKASERKDIMSTLLHVTDFSQNNEFRDHYLPELSQDLSKIWFIYSMNELPKDPAMLDRLEIIKIDGYTQKDKKIIAKEYIFPKYSNELNIVNLFTISDKCLSYLINFDKSEGIRDLERNINLILEKIYFFIHNKDYEYNWFIKMKESIYNQKIVLSEELIKMIIGKDKEDFIYYQ